MSYGSIRKMKKVANFCRSVDDRIRDIRNRNSKLVKCKCSKEAFFIGKDSQVVAQVEKAGWSVEKIERNHKTNAIINIVAACPKCAGKE